MTSNSSKSHRSGERDSQRQSQGAGTLDNVGHNSREAVSRGRSKDHHGRSRRHTTGSTTEEDDSPGPALTKKRPVPADSDTEVQAAPVPNRLGNQLGRIAGRMVTMFSPFTEILTTGVRYKGVNYDPHNHTAQQNAKYYRFLELETLCPQLYDTLQKMGVSGPQDLAKHLDLGRSSARSEDINSIKHAIGQWHSFTPEYKPAQKHLHGFHHEECGRLLCPVEKDWSDPRTKEGLRSGVIRVLPGDFPAFLYHNELLNKADLFDGFLKNELLVKGVIHILIGPSAALTVARSTRRGNAALHSIKSVTAEMIAYVASIERFVLDSQVTFGVGGTNGQWPYKKFYNAILAVLNDAPANVLEEIIEWFNDQVFKGGLYDSDEGDDDFITGSSLAAQMRAQAAKDHEGQSGQ